MSKARTAFGQKLRELRKQRGLSGQELGLQLGVERTVVARYESGRSFPSVPVLIRLGRALQVSVDRLLFDDYENRDEIEDKELVSYLAKIDRLDHRERALVKIFLDSILAREELEELKRAARHKKAAP